MVENTEVLAAVQKLHLEVTDRLARIETSAANLRVELLGHTEQDARNFDALHADLDTIKIDREVAKRVAKSAARKTAAVSGASVGGILMALVEAFKLWVR